MQNAQSKKLLHVSNIKLVADKYELSINLNPTSPPLDGRPRFCSSLYSPSPGIRSCKPSDCQYFADQFILFLINYSRSCYLWLRFHLCQFSPGLPLPSSPSSLEAASMSTSWSSSSWSPWLSSSWSPSSAPSSAPSSSVGELTSEVANKRCRWSISATVTCKRSWPLWPFASHDGQNDHHCHLQLNLPAKLPN